MLITKYVYIGNDLTDQVRIIFCRERRATPRCFFFGSMAWAVLPFFLHLIVFIPCMLPTSRRKCFAAVMPALFICCRYISYCSLPQRFVEDEFYSTFPQIHMKLCVEGTPRAFRGGLIGSKSYGQMAQKKKKKRVPLPSF